MLMARGAVISMVSVIFVLPALLLLCDGLIRATTLGMGGHHKHHTQSNQEVLVK